MPKVMVLGSQSSIGRLRNIEDLENVRVATHDGTPIFLKDVATVSEGWAPRQGVVSRGETDDVPAPAAVEAA